MNRTVPICAMLMGLAIGVAWAVEEEPGCLADSKVVPSDCDPMAGPRRKTVRPSAGPNANPLQEAIDEYVALRLDGAVCSGVITVAGDLAAPCAEGRQALFEVQCAYNLTIRGDELGDEPRRLSQSECAGAEGIGLSIFGSSDVRLHSLRVVQPAKPPQGNPTGDSTGTRYGIKVTESDRVELSHIKISSDDPCRVRPSVGIMVALSRDLLIRDSTIRHVAGQGMVLRNVNRFEIVGNRLEELTNAVSSDGGATNAGIQVDQLHPCPDAGLRRCPARSSSGRIANNLLSKLPSQGIYIDAGEHIAIRGNTLLDISMLSVDPPNPPPEEPVCPMTCPDGKDCGGRGI